MKRFSLLLLALFSILLVVALAHVFASYDPTAYVPTTRTVNGHALSGNVSITASDVGVTAYVTGTTGSVGGGLLTLGVSATGTATVTGASAGKPCYAAPSDGTSLTTLGSGLGLTVSCVVTSSNTATVYLNVTVAGTPTAKTYNVVAFP